MSRTNQLHSVTVILQGGNLIWARKLTICRPVSVCPASRSLLNVAEIIYGSTDD